MVPAPNAGRTPIGRTSFDWSDEARTDPYAPDPTGVREVVVWMWYPAAPSGDGATAEYLPGAWSPVAQFLGLDVDGLRSHAVTDAELAGGPARWPVLILSPSGFPPLLLSGLAEGLASSGYVVAGINHTFETTVTAFSDGRVLPANPAAIGGALGPQTGSHDEVFAGRADVCRYKVRDVAFVADQLAQLDAESGGRFERRLDLRRLGAAGHSFGGNAAVEWMRQDPRCRAAVNLDGAVWTEVGEVGVERPVLQLLADHPEFALPPDDAVRMGIAPSTGWFEAEKAIMFDGWRRIHERATPGYTVRIGGATHLSFMDVPNLPVVDGSVVTTMLAATTIDPQRMQHLTVEVVRAFLDRHLAGTASGPLDGPSAEHPELSFGPS